MGAEALPAIFNALSTIYEDQIERQWNRVTYMLEWIQAKAGVSEGNGKQVAFGVEFTGATAASQAEGSDVPASEFASDINEPATFPWATYRSSFQVSEQEVDAARRAAGSPTALMDLFGERLLGSQAQIALQIEKDVLSGTGVDTNGNPTIIGIFGGALSATGAYGGLNPATYTEWASNVVSNGGTLRSLTPDLMAQVDQQIFVAASLPWDTIVTSAGVTRKYLSFFTQGPPVTGQVPLVRMNDGGANPNYGMGVANNAKMQLEQLYWQGKRVMRNAFSPANKMAFLNMDKLMIKYLPHVAGRNEIELFQTLGLQGSTGGGAPIQATGIPARVAELGKTGDSHKVTLRATVAMAVRRRNACGLLTDISEA
jgi:hypothetical protein